MYIKFIFLLLLLEITFVKDNPPQLKFEEWNNLKCSDSNSLGKLDFSMKYSYTSFTETIKSYFMFFFEKNSKKLPSICQLYYNMSELNDIEGNERLKEEMKNVKNKLNNLKEKLSLKLGTVKKNVETLEDLGTIFNYNLMLQLKTINDKMAEMEKKIDDFTEEKILGPLDVGITNIVNDLYDLDMPKLKNKINETVCNLKIDIIEGVKNQNLKQKIDEQKDSIKQKIGEIGGKMEDSPILKDIFAQLKNNSEAIKNSEFGEKISQLKDIFQSGNSSIFNDLSDNFKEKTYEFIISKISELLTKFNNGFINGLLNIQTLIEKIKDLNKEGNNAKTIEDMEALIQEEFEKLKVKIDELIQNDEIIKQILETFGDIKEKVADKIEELEIEKKMKDKIEELKVIFNQIEEVSKDRFEDIIDNIKDINLKNVKEKFSNIKDLNVKLFKEIKDIIDIDEIIKEFKDIFGDFSFGDDSEKNLFEKLKEKSSDFVDQTILLKSFVENIKEEYDIYKDKFKEDGVIEAFESYSKNLNSLLKDLNIFNEKSIDDVENTFENFLDTIKNIDINDLLNQLSKLTFTSKIVEEIKKLELDDNIEELKEIFKQNSPMEILTDERDNVLDILSDMKDKIGTIYDQELFDPIKEKINDKKLEIEERLKKAEILDEFKNYISSIEDINDVFEEGRSNRIETIFKVLDEIGTLDTEDLKEKLSEIPELTVETFDQIADLINVQEIVDKLKEMFSNGEASEVYNEQKDKIEVYLKDLYEKIQDINSFEELKENLGDIKDQLMDKFNELGFSDYMSSFEGYFENLTDLLSSLNLENLGNNSSISEPIYEILDKIKNIDSQDILVQLSKFEDLPGDIYDTIKGLNEGDGIIKNIQKLLDQTDSKIIENKDKLMKYLSELKENLQNNLDPKTVSQIKELLAKMGDQLGITDEVLDKFNNHFGTLKDLLVALNGLASEDAKKAEQTIYNIVGNLSQLNIDDIKEKIEDMAEMGVEKAKDILNIEETIDDLKEVFNGEKDIKEFISEKKDEILEQLTDLKEKVDGESEEFLEMLEDKFQPVIEIIAETGAIDSFEKHFDSLKTLINDYIDMPSIEELSTSVDTIKDKLKNVNGTELVLLLNSTLFNFKDDFFEQIDTLPKLEKIIDNCGELFEEFITTPSKNNLNSIKDYMENVKDKLKKNNYTTKFIDKFEEIKDVIKEELEKSGILDKYGGYIDIIKDFKDKAEESLDEKDIPSLEELLGNMKEKLSPEGIKGMFDDFKDSLSSCDNEFIEKLDIIDDVKESFDYIKEQFENSQLKEAIDDSIENFPGKVEEIIEYIKDMIEDIKEDKRFEEFMKMVDSINDKLEQPLEKIKENERVQDLKEKFDNIKTIIENMKDKVEAIEVKEILYDLKDKIPDFNFNKMLVGLNETKDEFLKERKNYKELESKAEKLEYIFNSGKDFSKDRIENAEKITGEIKDKLKSLNNEKLNNIIDKVDEYCANILDKINKDEINEKLENAISKVEDLEKKLNNFPENGEEKEYQEAYDEIKGKVNGLNLTGVINSIDTELSENLEIANLTLYTIRDILLMYANKPEGVDNDEITKNLSEIFKDEFSEFNESIPEIFNNSKLAEQFSKIFENEDFKGILDTVEEIKTVFENYEDKSIEDINKEIKEILENSKIGQDFNKRQEKIKEIYEKLQNEVKENLDLSALENIKNKISKDFTEGKEKLDEFIEKMKELNEKIKALFGDDYFPKTIDFIKRSISKFNFTSIIELFKEIEKSNISVSQEIDNAKRVKELTSELQEIYDSDPLLNIFNKYLKGSRILSEKGKTIKKIKKNKRRLDSTGNIKCKLDDVDSLGDLSSEELNDTKMEYKIISKNKFSFSMSSKITLNIQNDQLKCQNNYINTVKQNVNYTQHNSFTSNATEGRIKFRIVTKIRRTFVIPSFFYLLIRVRIYRKSYRLSSLRNLQDDEDSDTFCILNDDEYDEDSKEEGAPLDCFLYDDNVSDIDAIGNFSSDYVDLTNNNNSLTYNEDNDNTNSDNPSDSSSGTSVSDSTNGEGSKNNTNNVGRFFYRKNKGGLKGGAIAGLVLGILAALAIIIAILYFCKNKKSPNASYEGNLSDSHNNFQISHNSVKMPVNE